MIGGRNFGEVWARMKARLEDRVGPREAEGIVRAVREDVFQEKSETEMPSAEDLALLEEMLNRLLAGEPVQYVTGWAPFYGYMLEVTPDVLIPRPETEELVYEILHHPAFAKKRGVRVLDVGTGSGCIAVALARQRPDWEVHGIDLSEKALEVARRNADNLGTSVAFRQMDVRDEASWAALPHFDLIASNPPYIAPSEQARMDLHVRRHEPAMALFAPEEDPLLFYRILRKLGESRLHAGGWLFAEINALRAEDTLSLFTDDAWTETEILDDLQGKPRILIAQKR